MDITTITGIREQVLTWLQRGKRFGPIDTDRGDGRTVFFGANYRLEIFGPGYDEPGIKGIDPDTHSLSLHIWTATNSYCIRAKPSPAVTGSLAGQGYLGCVASRRAPQPGEDHTRGSDLADGCFSEETWAAIMLDIVSYEALGVVEPAVGVPISAV